MSEDLFERYLRNELDEDGAKRLSAVLAAEEGSRAFSEFVREWTLLGEAARQREAQAGRAGTRKIRKRAPQSLPLRGAFGWAAALAAAVLFMILFAAPARTPAPLPGVARQAPAPEEPVAAPRRPEPERPAIPRPEAERPAPTPPPPPLPLPPAPAPAPAPAPPAHPSPRPEPRPTEADKVTRTILARILRVQGEVQRVSASGNRKLKAGEGLAANEGLELSGSDASAALEYPDGTRVELGPDSTVERLAERQGRKVLSLLRGTATATVTKQPAGRSVSVATPHGEALAIGTQFSLAVSPESTRLEVQEGRVRLSRSDGAAIEVAAGHFSVAAKGLKLESRPILHVRELQDGAGYAGTRDSALSGAEPARTFGSEPVLEVDGDEAEGKKLYGLIRWDLSEIPPAAVLRSASISLYVTNESQGKGYSFYELKRDWSEADACWRLAAPQQPWRIPGARSSSERGAEPLGSLAPRLKGELRILILPAGEALIQSWIRNPALNHGLILANDANSDGFKFSSREAPQVERRPKLTLTYTLGAK